MTKKNITVEAEVVGVVGEDLGTIHVRCRETGFTAPMPLEQWNAYGDQERDLYEII